MIIDADDNDVLHYGTKRHSGRYPWGSGGQHESPRTFLDSIAEMKRQGLKQPEIAKGLGLESTTELRAYTSIARNEQKQADISMAQRLKDKGLSNVEIGKRMSTNGRRVNESVVRTWLAPGAKDKADILTATSEMLKKEVGTGNLVQIGRGVQHHLQPAVSSTMLNNAVAVLKAQGYEVHSVPVDQLGTGNKTNVKVLCPPGTTIQDAYRRQSEFKLINSYTQDHGRSWLGIHPPMPLHPDRVKVNYAEDGGNEADGVIYVRRGVPDVSIGGSSYAQVRIMVGGTHYLKGMAMYKDGLPSGVDVVFNTAKAKSEIGDDKFAAMKPLKTKVTDGSIDMDNPFGSNIRRQIVEGEPGKEKVTSVMNIVNEEGKWSTWSKTISSQMLSKQSPTLAKQQLDVTYKQKVAEFERIASLTNPAVRKKLLLSFGDGVDESAVHLEAAKFPRSHGHHVILPIETMPPTHVYAPRYRQGERVVLIRHPHGGTFEIPELIVDNNHPEARRLLGQAADAIGIHHSVAERLSGADFDGDTVLVIPNNGNKIKTTAALEGLKGFDPKRDYPGYPGMKVMNDTQTQMGKISNLITDMTLKKASTVDLAKAVRHSMVVIDAEKHELNYKLSAQRNNIAQLTARYQAKDDGRRAGGASTLISRAGAEVRVPHRRDARVSEGGPIDKATGKRIYVPTGKKIIGKNGVEKDSTTKVKQLYLHDDAHDLVSSPSGTQMERVYADHSNKLKDLANHARKMAVNTPNSVYSESAAKVYHQEVSSLVAKIKIAEHRAPIEVQAQVIGNSTYRQKLRDNPGLDKDQKKKVKFQAIAEARSRLGIGSKQDFRVTDKEWEAIQAGAVSNNRLNQILNHANMDDIVKHATPRQKRLMSTTKIKQAHDLAAQGYTRAQIADHLGVSVTTLELALNPKEGS